MKRISPSRTVLRRAATAAVASAMIGASLVACSSGGGSTASGDAKDIESALEAAGGVQKRAAELLHIKPTTLNEMIKRHDIRPRRKKAANGAGARAEDDAEHETVA